MHTEDAQTDGIPKEILEERIVQGYTKRASGAVNRYAQHIGTSVIVLKIDFPVEVVHSHIKFAAVYRAVRRYQIIGCKKLVNTTGGRLAFSASGKKEYENAGGKFYHDKDALVSVAKTV
jgi:hypothetical protein